MRGYFWLGDSASVIASNEIFGINAFPISKSIIVQCSFRTWFHGHQQLPWDSALHETTFALKLVPANAFLSTYYIWYWQLCYHGFFFAVESIDWKCHSFLQIKKYGLFGFCLLRHGQVEISFNFKKPWYHIPSIVASHKSIWSLGKNYKPFTCGLVKEKAFGF